MRADNKYTDYRGLLINYCAKNKLGNPHFEYNMGGSYHAPMFKCVIHFGQYTFEGEWCGDKRASTNSVCKMACRELVYKGDEARLDYLSKFDPDFNYKSAVQEGCQKLRLMYPIYSFQKVGIDHKPYFKCNVTFNNNLISDDETFIRKSIAEQHISYNILRDWRQYVEMSNDKAVSIICKKDVKITTYDDRQEIDMSDDYIPSETDDLIDNSHEDFTINHVNRFNYSFSRKEDYVAMVKRYCLWHGLRLPLFFISTQVIGRRTLYFGELSCGDIRILGDTPCDSRNEAMNDVSFIFLNTSPCVRVPSGLKYSSKLISRDVNYLDDREDLPRALWFNVFSHLSCATVNKLILVCKAFFNYVDEDDYWLSVVQERVKKAFIDNVQLMRDFDFVYGIRFNMRRFIMRKQIVQYFNKCMRTLLNIESAKQISVNLFKVIRDIDTLCKDDSLFDNKLYPAKIIDVLYNDKDKKRWKCDVANPLLENKYCVSREIVFGKQMIVTEKYIDKTVERLIRVCVSALGGGIECTFVGLAYKGSYHPYKTIYLPCVRLLIEWGFSGFDNDRMSAIPVLVVSGVEQGAGVGKQYQLF